MREELQGLLGPDTPPYYFHVLRVAQRAINGCGCSAVALQAARLELGGSATAPRPSLPKSPLLPPPDWA
ncbi:MAG: hypothetical protein WA354_19800, partial [Terracidiphilus sp.]